MILETLETPEVASYDIVVAGGGVAGTAAALSAARLGCKTLLLEKSILLGGLATLGLVNYIEPLCNGRGKKIIGGMCEELLRLSIAHGYDTLPDSWREAAEGKREHIQIEIAPNPEQPPRYVTRFSPHLFAMSLTNILNEHGVDIMFDTIACKPAMDRKTCTGVIVENKSGRGFYRAKLVVDATGDCDLLYRAGVPTATQGNWFSFWGRTMDMQTLSDALEKGKINHSLKHFAIGSNLYGKGHPEDMAKLDGTNAKDVSYYVLKAHQMAMEQMKGNERFQNDVVMLPGMPQFRTTRRIAGAYELTENDQYTQFEDSIGAICDFTQRDVVYEVPYRCLHHEDFPNLITAGRSISSSGWAWDVTRVIPPAILTGQAAGTAAAMAVKASKRLADVSIDSLQETLADTGVLIHLQA